MDSASDQDIFGCSVKMDLNPLRIFPEPSATDVLSTEAAGEILKEERVLVPRSGVLAWQALVACTTFSSVYPALAIVAIFSGSAL